MEKTQINKIKSKIKKKLDEYGVIRAGIFGSYARGDQKKSSDIDIVVEVKKDFSLFDLVALEREISEILKKKVDLITYKSIHPLLKKRILSEEVKILW